LNYVWHLLVLAILYALLGSSLNLLCGYTGLVSLCHAAFYGLGAYCSAILMTKAGLGFFPAALVCVVLTGLASLAVAVPTLRLRGDYFILATLGFQIIVFSTLQNWVSLTNGPYGITGIPIPSIMGFSFDSPLLYLLLTVIVCAPCAAATRMLVQSQFGRALRCVREDEIAAASLGKDVPRLKICAFVIAAALAAVCGVMFAGYSRYIDPTSFSVAESIFILSVVIIGGAGNLAGPVVGAAFMVLFPEVIGFIGLPDAVAANLRQVIYGVALVWLMRFRPQGIVGDYGFD